ncbi:MAG: hypothetical protein NPINA01_22640 [Nitrospinaceae bacterium]|nr:MAG: hypothetical protein NPINA01_22640 [Nitrospinaceae bacterium]
MNPSQDIKKILVIRSATRILNQTLKALKQEFPDSKITVLAPKGVEEVVAPDPLVDEVLTIGNHRRMSVFNYGRRPLEQLRRRKFDLAVSLYNVDHGLGYSNIDLLAWASKAKEIRGYNARGTYVDLTGKGVIKKWFLEKTTLIWVGLNYIATGLLFFCITLGLIGEWCVRKLFSPGKISDKENAIPKKRHGSPIAAPEKVSKVLTQV